MSAVKRLMVAHRRAGIQRKGDCGVAIYEEDFSSSIMTVRRISFRRLW